MPKWLKKKPGVITCTNYYRYVHNYFEECFVLSCYHTVHSNDNILSAIDAYSIFN
jgi:hypothetical protein